MSTGDKATKTTGSGAVVIATAAVTLALGVTAAALGGYLTPRPAASPELAPAAPLPADEAPQPAVAPEPALLYAYERAPGPDDDAPAAEHDDEPEHDDESESDSDEGRDDD